MKIHTHEIDLPRWNGTYNVSVEAWENDLYSWSAKASVEVGALREVLACGAPGAPPLRLESYVGYDEPAGSERRVLVEARADGICTFTVPPEYLFRIEGEPESLAGPAENAGRTLRAPVRIANFTIRLPDEPGGYTAALYLGEGASADGSIARVDHVAKRGFSVRPPS